MREAIASPKSEAPQPQSLSATLIVHMQCLAEERGPSASDGAEVAPGRVAVVRYAIALHRRMFATRHESSTGEYA